MDYVKEFEKQNQQQSRQIKADCTTNESGIPGGAARKKRAGRHRTGTQGPPPISGTKLNVTNWCVLIHLSQFTNFVFAGAGLILPIVLWQIKKDESEIINRHGRNVANWIITETILLVISFILTFSCGIGVIPLILVAVAGIIFPIIGASKAGKGELWRYPWAITFIK